MQHTFSLMHTVFVLVSFCRFFTHAFFRGNFHILGHLYITPVIWKNLVNQIFVKIEFDAYLDLLGFSLLLSKLKCIKLFSLGSILSGKT